MRNTVIGYAFFFAMVLLACNNKSKTKTMDTFSYPAGTFGYDLLFLQKHDSLVVLRQDSTQVLVSPKYQGKVFTSTADGMNGKSFGWVNYKTFTGPVDSHMNAYGGENRFWLGPEGGPFSLFFEKGKEMTFANWKTPAPIDTDTWSVVKKDDWSVHLQKEMALTNYAGTPLQLTVDRTVAILDRRAIENQLQQSVDTSVKVVAYNTTNSITNSGNKPWTEQTGAPCIWILDMFIPSAETTIVIPYEEKAVGNIATTNYFGEIPPDRIRHHKGVLFFKADGKSRGKMGLSPARAKPVAGSYDASANVLTITFFDVSKGGMYLNQEWTTNKPPYTGDAMNAYNDGPLEDGSQMGPFYEIESVSPAAFLAPGGKATHQHSVFHLTGNKKELDLIARKHLGASLEEIMNALK